MKISNKIKIVSLLVGLFSGHLFSYPVSYQKLVTVDKDGNVKRCVDLIGDIHIPDTETKEITCVKDSEGEFLRSLSSLNSRFPLGEFINLIWELPPVSTLQNTRRSCLAESFIAKKGRNFYEYRKFLKNLNFIPSDYIRYESSKYMTKISKVFLWFLLNLENVFDGKTDFNLLIDVVNNEYWGQEFDKTVINKLTFKLLEIRSRHLISIKEFDFLMTKIMEYEDKSGSLETFSRFCKKAKEAFGSVNGEEIGLVFSKFEKELVACEVIELEILLNIFSASKSIVYCGETHAQNVSNLLKESDFIKITDCKDFESLSKSQTAEIMTSLEKKTGFKKFKDHAKKVIISKITESSVQEVILKALEGHITDYVVSPEAWTVLLESPEESYRKHLEKTKKED